MTRRYHLFHGLVRRAGQRHRRSNKILRLSVDLPIIIECVDTAEKINAILPELDGTMGRGLITLETLRVIAYRPEGGAA